MNLLVINFEMNSRSRVLAWQIKVAKELALRFEKVTVFTHIYSGESLPSNMEVVVFPSLLMKAPMRFAGGKWLTGLYLLPYFIKGHFKACFIHMNYVWSYRLFAFFKVFKIRTVLWYAHGSVTRSLRVSHYCVDKVVTSTPEGFRIRSKKVNAIGQSIDTDLFSFISVVPVTNNFIYVGRISKRKRIDLILKALDVSNNILGNSLALIIIGDAITPEDEVYLRELKSLAVSSKLENNVHFWGFVNMDQIPKLYRNVFLHVNVSQTGSMDKTIIEALSCGCPVLTSNVALLELLQSEPECIIRNESPLEIAKQITWFYKNQKNEKRKKYRDLVINKHDFNGFINKVVGILKSC
jgi:glycosyltransferase involved in cell wall biosynthesis